jgi:hypothetical protein
MVVMELLKNFQKLIEKIGENPQTLNIFSIIIDYI